MPTIDDLHDLFADLEQRAPEPGASRRGRRSTRPTRARVAITLSAAAVAVLATAIGVLAARSDDHGTAGRSIAPAARAPRHASPSVAVDAPSSPTRPATSDTGPSPVQVSGLPGLRLVAIDPHLAAGDVVIKDGDGVQWDFGWNNAPLDPADKPDTSTVTVDGRAFIVYPDQDGGLNGVGVSAPGFGMTITAVGHSFTLDQYRPFLSHVAYAATLGDRNTWFADALGS